MSPCFCCFNPPSPSISKYIADQTMNSILRTEGKTIEDAKQIHTHIIKNGLTNNIVANNPLLAFCATGPAPARDMNYALSVFRQIENPRIFSWNTIIRGFCESSDPLVAILLFVEMLTSSGIEPTKFTYPSVFKAYTQLGKAKNGAQLHGRIIKIGLENDRYIRNSIIHMYASCGLLRDAWKLFDENNDQNPVPWISMITGHSKCGQVEESWRLFCKLPYKSEGAWNTMINGFVRNGKCSEAIDLFRQMQEEKMRPSERALASLVAACGILRALDRGKWIHNYLQKNDIKLNTFLATAIINMFCKCGDPETAYKIFESLPQKGLSSWNTVMLGLASNGYEDDVFELFSELESSDCLRPDYMSFLGILVACRNTGQVDRARYYFKLMTEKYRIKPIGKHYGCIVDVLGRKGLLVEAAEVVRSMPMKPDSFIWASLLLACKIHGNVDIANWAAENLITSYPGETSSHVLMSNVYAAAGQLR